MKIPETLIRFQDLFEKVPKISLRDVGNDLRKLCTKHRVTLRKGPITRKYDNDMFHQFQFSFEYIGKCGNLIRSPIFERDYWTDPEMIRILKGTLEKYPPKFDRRS